MRNHPSPLLVTWLPDLLRFAPGNPCAICRLDPFTTLIAIYGFCQVFAVAMRAFLALRSLTGRVAALWAEFGVWGGYAYRTVHNGRTRVFDVHSAGRTGLHPG